MTISYYESTVLYLAKKRTSIKSTSLFSGSQRIFMISLKHLQLTEKSSRHIHRQHFQTKILLIKPSLGYFKRYRQSKRMYYIIFQEKSFQNNFDV